MNRMTCEDKSVNAEIGERAARVIDQASENEVSKRHKLMARIGAAKHTYWAWSNGEAAPSARHLRQMALIGLDVDYILTGR